MGFCSCIFLLKMLTMGNESQRNIMYSFESGFSRPDVILRTEARVFSVLLKYERRASYCSSKRCTLASKLSHLVRAALSSLCGHQQMLGILEMSVVVWDFF